MGISKAQQEHELSVFVCSGVILESVGSDSQAEKLVHKTLMPFINASSTFSPLLEVKAQDGESERGGRGVENTFWLKFLKITNNFLWQIH